MGTPQKRKRFQVGQPVKVVSWGLRGVVVSILTGQLGTLYKVETKEEGVIPCRDRELLPLFDETISKGEKVSGRKKR
jgi:hypothetical protein